MTFVEPTNGHRRTAQSSALDAEHRGSGWERPKQKNGFDCVLEIDGITDRDHALPHGEAIHVASFGWSESQTAAAQSGLGGGISKVHVNDLVIQAPTSGASPRLMVACADGLHIPNARLTCRAPDIATYDFLIMTLSDVLVSGYRIAAGPHTHDASPMDEITLNFRHITMEYRRPDPDSGHDGVTSGEWNIKENKGTSS